MGLLAILEIIHFYFIPAYLSKLNVLTFGSGEIVVIFSPTQLPVSSVNINPVSDEYLNWL